ncbi:DEAD/DEAH box helicase [Neptunomonas phycophila]|uniref:DEAD/DEAH box helicase n=1 Tax=Neptunomonas phycophila TaxID=1572645 RepID=UPI001BEC9F53|nr:DEAD/DEAH box helicase [Neptunomonas phycophila]MBT3144892.1 DEAD/DEAH box helicase [Neptunomonas phycophila]
MTAFSDLHLCPELQFTLQSLGYDKPTPIQEKAIPLILEGKDLLAEAQTGTGKTAGFALPMIERLSKTPADPDYHHIRGLVLTPTRELAVQVGDHTLAYGKHLGMRVISLYGGARFDNQIRKMKRGADILVATPGRLLEMVSQKKISLAQVEILVLDEADRMLDLGFIHDIKKIMSFIPAQRQTLLFSATFNPAIESLADTLLKSPVKVSTSTRNATAKLVQQKAYKVDNSDKSDILSFLIDGCQWSQTLVFTRTKRRADMVCDYLNAEGISAVAMHGDKLQRERNAALSAFVNGEVRVMVATDVAARGLDIESLPQVINYDLPNLPEAYVHRIGRTGRAGKEGTAISLVAPDEKNYLADICQLISKQIPLQAVPTIESGKLIDAKKSAHNPPPKRRKNKSGKASHLKTNRTKAATSKKVPNESVTQEGNDKNTSPRRHAGRRSLFDQ